MVAYVFILIRCFLVSAVLTKQHQQRYYYAVPLKFTFRTAISRGLATTTTPSKFDFSWVLHDCFDSSNDNVECPFSVKRRKRFGLLYRFSFHQSRSTNVVYDKFRQRSCLFAAQQQKNDQREDTSIDPVMILAQEATSILTRNNYTWKRLQHLVHMACSGATKKNSENKDWNNNSLPSMADIGCDHGLLAISLSATGKFKKVTGTDISSKALKDGALYFHQTILDILFRADKRPLSTSSNNNINTLSVEFRIGNGLEPLHPGEADAICIAGIGSKTMEKILFVNNNISTIQELDRLGTTQLYLQPTNPRPRHLVTLYDQLQDFGWTLHDEKIEHVSSRWYISCAFTREIVGCGHTQNPTSERQMPGYMLAKLPSSGGMSKEYGRYVKHHLKWIAKDSQRKCFLCPADKRWLESLDKIDRSCLEA